MVPWSGKLTRRRTEEVKDVVDLRTLGGGFKYFSPLPGEMIQFDELNGLKPPTSTRGVTQNSDYSDIPK